MNAYLIILISVVLGGAGITIWGWRIQQAAQRVQQWPTVEGVIEELKPSSEQSDLLPHILYAYDVQGEHYRKVFEFPSGTHPLPEFTQAYMDKYPVGTPVTVYYNPQQPLDSTLEPRAQGDWLVLLLGILMTVGGIGALAVSL
jgi:hypothetical protein